jgi:hypothetical protein
MPVDLSVWPPTKYERVVNLKTVKVLGLEALDALLALADEVVGIGCDVSYLAHRVVSLLCSNTSAIRGATDSGKPSTRRIYAFLQP